MVFEMDIPGDAIELEIGAVWMDDGIVIHRANTARRTGESVSELFRTISGLLGGVPGPVLFDARNWQGTDVDGWLAAFRNVGYTVSKAVMLIDSASSVQVGPFPEAISEVVPLKILDDEDEALAFLRS